MKAAILDESLLQRMELAILGETFDGLDLFSGAAGRQCQARAHDPAVDNDTACAADTDGAAFLRSSQTERIPEDLKQEPV